MDHTKQTTFAGFVNVEKHNKYWVDGHFEFSEDCPTLFRFNTKEEKARVQDVAQSYLDNWGFEAVELVIFEVKSRHLVTLKKRTESEKENARLKAQKESDDNRIKMASEDNVAEGAVLKPEPKKRGRKPKSSATI
jgi:preprotein translocase subunit SecF